jgi:hypothetical protein
LREKLCFFDHIPVSSFLIRFFVLLKQNSGFNQDSDFFDLPGTMNATGVLKTLACMDCVFVPISADRVVLESTLQYATTIHDNLITTGKSNIK